MENINERWAFVADETWIYKSDDYLDFGEQGKG